MFIESNGNRTEQTRYWTLNSRKIWKKKSDEFALGCCLLLSFGGCSHEAAGGTVPGLGNKVSEMQRNEHPMNISPLQVLESLAFPASWGKEQQMQRLFLLETPMIRCDKLRCQLSSCGQVENCHPASDVDQVNLGTDGTGKPRIPCSLLIWRCEGNHAFICIKDFPTTYTENLWMFHCLAPYVTLGLEWIRWVSLGITMYHWHLNCLSLSASRSKKKTRVCWHETHHGRGQVVPGAAKCGARCGWFALRPYSFWKGSFGEFKIV